MKKRKILFLGESYRADAITWTNGLKEFGDFEIIHWELKTPSHGFLNRLLRITEFIFAYFTLQKIIKLYKPDMVIAERTTSYGFLAALSGVKPIAIAQQGFSDLWPEGSILLPVKKTIQQYAFKKATLVHAWGPVMKTSMLSANVDPNKILVLPKGIDLRQFEGAVKKNSNTIKAIVTRSLLPEYNHETIIKAFELLNQSRIDFVLTIVGDGKELTNLQLLATQLNIKEKVVFTGRIANTDLPSLLKKSNLYLSMPVTEGVSASLFEAMATNCYPIVSDIPGNKSWIRHRENGQLIAAKDHVKLAEEIIWLAENQEYKNTAIAINKKWIEENANYQTNMKIIADKYHELINIQKEQ